LEGAAKVVEERTSSPNPRYAIMLQCGLENTVPEGGEHNVVLIGRNWGSPDPHRMKNAGLAGQLRAGL
jgi:hypothetical protein